jgi:hypothetical protein
MRLNASPSMQAAAAARSAPTPKPIAPTPQLQEKTKPPELTPEGRRRANHDRYKRVHDVLRRRWPLVFSWARPLAIGIHLDVQAVLGDEVKRKDLRDFFYRWVHRDPYLAAVARGEPRVGLDGEPVPDTSPPAASSASLPVGATSETSRC